MRELRPRETQGNIATVHGHTAGDLGLDLNPPQTFSLPSPPLSTFLSLPPPWQLPFIFFLCLFALKLFPHVCPALDYQLGL